MTTSTLLTQTLIVSPEVLFQEFDNEAVLLDLSSECYFGLDQTGAVLWRLIERYGDLQTVYQTMRKDYSVDAETLLSDLDAFVAKLQEVGLVSLR